MICPFCRFEFDLEDSPIACPACGYAMPDFDIDEEPECCSLVQDEERGLKIEDGYIKDAVFYGTFDECFKLMQALECPF